MSKRTQGKKQKKSSRKFVEKPDPKRPQLWAGLRNGTYPYMDFRLRIVMPKGTSVWTSGNHKEVWRDNPCWERGWEDAAISTRVKSMATYDERFGRETLFLGNL